MPRLAESTLLASFDDSRKTGRSRGIGGDGQNEYGNRELVMSPSGREFRPRPSAGPWLTPGQVTPKTRAMPSPGRSRDRLCAEPRRPQSAHQPHPRPRSSRLPWTPQTLFPRRCCAVSPTRFTGMVRAAASDTPIPLTIPSAERDHAVPSQGGRVDGVLLLNGRLSLRPQPNAANRCPRCQPVRADLPGTTSPCETWPIATRLAP
jgi:hypothetical protein